MRRVRRVPGRLTDAIQLPESSEESEADDLDADPDFDPDERGRSQLEMFLDSRQQSQDGDSSPEHNSADEEDENGNGNHEDEENHAHEDEENHAVTSPGSTPSLGKKKKKPSLVWTDVSANDNIKELPQWKDQRGEPNAIQLPIDYFRNFFDVELLRFIVTQSNLYADQNHPDKPLNLTVKELEQYFGICIGMSIFEFPRARMYWSQATRLDKIANIMSRDRWDDIKANLHFNDNSTIIRDESNRPVDKLFKIRPLVDNLKDKFRALPKDQFVCVDEQVVPYKGKSKLKQYNPKKPKKWGYKIFVLCDVTGLVYDFEIYSGKIEPVAGFPDIGASSNIVLKLSETIPKDMNYLMFFDNWFASLPLFFSLKSVGIESLGTVRTNRFPGLNFPADSEMKRDLGRGSVLEKKHVHEITAEEVRAVKWMDNRGVVLVSTFESAYPLSTVKRFDKSQSKELDVACPKAVITYNKFMGGVDLLDGLVAYYRIKIKSRKYYMRFVYHFLDMAVVNGWLIYRRDCKDNNYPMKDVLDLLAFKSEIFGVLCNEGKVARKRGRPSLADLEESALEERKKRGPAASIPEWNIRRDGVGHWPIVDDKRQRCKKASCEGKTVIKCSKCNVHLCLTKERNCFSSSFHVV